MFNFSFLKDVSNDPLWKEQIRERTHLSNINFKVWHETNLYSPAWWLMLISFIVIWYIWWKLVDKARLLEIVSFGLMITVYSVIVDSIATQYIIWGFPIRLIPLSPPFLYEDMCILPIIFMLVYQYFSSWKSYSIVLIGTALILAFVLEPIAVWLDLFELNRWKFIYSFPSYIIMGFLIKWVMYKLKAKQNQYYS